MNVTRALRKPLIFLLVLLSAAGLLGGCKGRPLQRKFPDAHIVNLRVQSTASGGESSAPETTYPGWPTPGAQPGMVYAQFMDVFWCHAGTADTPQYREVRLITTRARPSDYAKVITAMPVQPGARCLVVWKPSRGATIVGLYADAGGTWQEADEAAAVRLGGYVVLLVQVPKLGGRPSVISMGSNGLPAPPAIAAN